MLRIFSGDVKEIKNFCKNDFIKSLCYFYIFVNPNPKPEEIQDFFNGFEAT